MQRTAQARKARGGRRKPQGSRRSRCRRAARRRGRTACLPGIHVKRLAPNGTVPISLEALEDDSLSHDKIVAVQGIALPALEPRLQKRFLILVHSHMRSAPELAAGVAGLPSCSEAFAATQAAWRFLNNDRVGLQQLIDPIRQVARGRIQRLNSRFALLVHDWCKIAYKNSSGKRDLTQLTHETDVGYELMSALAVSADDGSPLAPMELHLKTANGVLSTRDPAPAVTPHLDQLLATMKASREWKLDKPFLHVIDREADSVDCYRQWSAEGFKFLVRADDRRVEWAGQSNLLSEIRKSLTRSKAFCKAEEDASYHGRPAQLWVAETSVILSRPAKKNVGGKRFKRAGRPLALRYIVVQLRSFEGKVLAEWMLLTNAPTRVLAEKLARCYYWRWRIESYFKLLKSHGQQMEQWQQETGLAIARRLLIASMACVVVWQLQADETPEATELKRIMIRLSGRQMKRNKPHTAPALLAGLWVLLSMLALLEHYDLDALRHLAAKVSFFPRR
jgi:Transposase DDE domain